MTEVLENIGLILTSSVLTILSTLIGVVLHRKNKVDKATAFFSSIPGGASEMVNLSRKYNADLQLVAASQTLRMLLIVLIVPAVYSLMIEVNPVIDLMHREPDLAWVALLLLIGGVVGVLFQWWGLPNSWQLGALLTSVILSCYFDLKTALPIELKGIGQWLLGCAMGCYVNRGFFKEAPPFMLRSMLSILAILVLTVPVAWLLSLCVGLELKTIALGMAPGSVSEMSLTAELLNLAVPLVTAMQVSRLLLVLFLAKPLFLLWKKTVRNESWEKA